MTLHYKDLEDFTANLLNQYPNRSIGLHTLRHLIARKFGFSDYKMKNAFKSLIEFKFIERDGLLDRFNITYMREQKAVKKDIEKELDNYG